MHRCGGVGQKGRTGYRWWLRGERPHGLCDRRFDWTYLYAAVRPATGDGFALVLPEVSTEAMSTFLERFADHPAPTPTRCWCLIRQDGTARDNSSFPRPSALCRCRHTRRS